MNHTTDAPARAQIVAHGRSIFERGLTSGSSGNLSVRVDDGIILTPTGVRLGELTSQGLSKVSLTGEHLSGPKPTKEVFLHLAMYRARPHCRAVAHLHSTHAAGLSCLDGLDPHNVLPPITAYFVMRVGRLPLIPYFAPGDQRLGDAAFEQAQTASSLLLANHGSLSAATSLQAACDAVEEIEETAKLHFLLRGQPVRTLTAEESAALKPPA